jgi:hypothetical protein
MGLIGVDLLLQLSCFFSYLRDVSYFHITHPFSCRVQQEVQLLSVNDLRNADTFLLGGHTIKGNL